MRCRALILSKCLLRCLLGCLLASWAHAQSSLPLAHEELLHSARAWEARARGDLAILALEKLVAARPDSPQALLELGELYLRMADMAAAARLRERLMRRFKDSAAATTFDIEYRFATRDRLQLASMQRLLQISRGAQLRIELDRMFPQGAPGGMLSLEYYRLLAGTPGGLQTAADGLRRLAASHPDDPRYQLALARFLLRSEATSLEGVRMLQALAHRDDIRTIEVDDALLGAFKDLGERTPTYVLQEYLLRHPGDTVVGNLLARQARMLEENQLLADNALGNIRADLQRRLLDEFNAALSARSNPDASAQLARELLKALRGELPIRAEDATLAAASWLQRSRRSIGSQQLELGAAQLEAALALRIGKYEALIAIAERIEALSAVEESGELLAVASRLAPTSAWLFETRVRWLIEHGQVDAALVELAAHSLDQKWTAAARDSLRAKAHEQRAQHAVQAGDKGSAIADLELAMRYAPDNAWSRYQLAGLYSQRGDPERGRGLFTDDVRASASPEMRYAQSLYLSSISATEAAFAAVDAIAAGQRSEGMRSQHDRLRIKLARAAARRHKSLGDAESARAALRAVESIAQQDIELTRELAFGWVDIDEPQRALELIEAYRPGEPADRELLLVKAEVLNRLDDTGQLTVVLARLRADPELSDAGRIELARLQRSLELRVIRGLTRSGQYAAAAQRLDALLEADPDDRTLRIARAELHLTMGQPRAARDRFAALSAEDPQDLDTRLSYVRALTESGDSGLARLQLQSVQEQVAANDVDRRLDIARRQLALDDAPGAVLTLESLLAFEPERAEVLIALGRAELAQRHFARARDYFARAERSADATLALQARRAGEQIDTRLQSRMESGFEVRHKPGDSGISLYDALVTPNSWLYALDFERRITAHADAFAVDSGGLSPDFDTAALLGTLQSAGPGTAQLHSNKPQSGISLALGYHTDLWSAEVGTTPLGFLLPTVIGAVEWTPQWRSLDVALGIERRAVTSSVLSFAGLRDPITGQEWGGVVESGPYAQLGLYRERYSISGSLRATALTGTNVASNRFLGLRSAADWRFFAGNDARAYLGLTVNLWNYQRNLQSYTFGNGGYYSPQSYLSVAIPLELQGTWAGWSYQLRATVSTSMSKTERAAFYPTDPGLQAAAMSPFFEASSGGGLSFSAYAAIERQVTPHLVLGGKLDLDRADFYEPTVLMLYLRHVFGAAVTQLAIPPRPVRPFN